MFNFHDKLKSISQYIIVGVICFAVGYLVKANSGPAKVETKIDMTATNELKALSLKYAELTEQNNKLKSSQKSKSKILITNKDGSSVLKEFTDSKSMESEVQVLTSKTAEYQDMVQKLQQQLTQEQTIRDNLARVNALATYGSDNKAAVEVNGSYSMLGVKHEQFFDGNWRSGVGLGFNF